MGMDIEGRLSLLKILCCIAKTVSWASGRRALISRIDVVGGYDNNLECIQKR